MKEIALVSTKMPKCLKNMIFGNHSIATLYFKKEYCTIQSFDL